MSLSSDKTPHTLPLVANSSRNSYEQIAHIMVRSLRFEDDNEQRKN